MANPAAHSRHKPLKGPISGWQERRAYLTPQDAESLAGETSHPLAHADGGVAAAAILNGVANRYLLAFEQGCATPPGAVKEWAQRLEKQASDVLEALAFPTGEDRDWFFAKAHWMPDETDAAITQIIKLRRAARTIGSAMRKGKRGPLPGLRALVSRLDEAYYSIFAKKPGISTPADTPRGRRHMRGGAFVLFMKSFCRLLSARMDALRVTEAFVASRLSGTHNLLEGSAGEPAAVTIARALHARRIAEHKSVTHTVVKLNSHERLSKKSGLARPKSALKPLTLDEAAKLAKAEWGNLPYPQQSEAEAFLEKLANETSNTLADVHHISRSKKRVNPAEIGRSFYHFDQ